MGAKRTETHRLRELIRLHRVGRGQRAISNQLRMGRRTVRRFMAALESAGVLSGEPIDLPDPAALRAALA